MSAAKSCKTSWEFLAPTLHPRSDEQEKRDDPQIITVSEATRRLTTVELEALR